MCIRDRLAVGRTQMPPSVSTGDRNSVVQSDRYTVVRGRSDTDELPLLQDAERNKSVQSRHEQRHEWLAGVCIVGYTMDAVYFSWLDTPVDVDDDLQLPHFSLREAILYDCSQNYTAGRSTKALCAHRSFYLTDDSGVNAP